MTYRSSSSADFFDHEEREEMRFLRALKGVLRIDVAAVQERDGLTQEQLAERLGFDPAHLSRLLSTDRHNSTLSLFRAMYRLGRRWTFGSTVMPSQKGRNWSAAASTNQPVRVSGLFTTTGGASLHSKGAPSPTSTETSRWEKDAALVTA